MNLNRQRLHLVCGGLSSNVMSADNRVRRHGTAKLQDAIPDVSGPQRDVHGLAPLPYHGCWVGVWWLDCGGDDLEDCQTGWESSRPRVCSSANAQSAMCRVWRHCHGKCEGRVPGGPIVEEGCETRWVRPQSHREGDG